MKKFGVVLSVVVTLVTSSVPARAHGYGPCGGGWVFAPLFAFGLGMTLAAASASAREYGPPVYYTPPPTIYTPQPSSNVAPPPQPPPPAPPTEEPVWTPSTPGAGHWVPDPQPYRYESAQSPRPKRATPAAQTVTITSSAGVPVYNNTQSR